MPNRTKAHLLNQAGTLHARCEQAAGDSYFAQPAPGLDSVNSEIQARLKVANELTESINNQCLRLLDHLKYSSILDRRLAFEDLSQNIACLIVKLSNMDDVICNFIAKDTP